MIQGHRLVVFIPAGRRRTMSVLLTNLRRFPEIDQVQIWVNTDGTDAVRETAARNNSGDLEWLRSLPEQWDKCVTYELPRTWARRYPKQLNTGGFYGYATEPGTIYVRMDDDIVYVDDDYFKNMAAARLANPDPPVIFGNIINNAITSYLHQQAGHLDRAHGVVEKPFCMDLVGWRSPFFAQHVHEVALGHIEAGTVPELYLDDYVLRGGLRFSISSFAFLGERMAKMLCPFERDEESWLSEKVPTRDKVDNVICGSAVVAHYSFFDQRKRLDELGILDRYRAVAEHKLADQYYELLGRSGDLAPS